MDEADGRAWWGNLGRLMLSETLTQDLLVGGAVLPPCWLFSLR